MPGFLSRLFGRTSYPVAQPVYPVAQAIPGGPSDYRGWATSVVEKIRVATIGGTLRFMPWLDHYTEETSEIRAAYPVMLKEPTVKAAFLTKVLAVCALPVQLHPQDPDDPRHKLAADFCLWNLKRVGKPKRGLATGNITSTSQGTAGIAWSVLHGGLIMGHSVCEKVWDPDPIRAGQWAGKRALIALKSRDTRYLHLGIDAFRNVEAVRGTGFNAGRIWDPKDFVIWSFLSLFESSAGISDFRSAYRAYWIKDSAWKLRALHLDKFASGPYLVGTYTDPSIQKAALEEALEKARANTWLAIPQGALVNVIDLAARGTADFASAIADCDKEILIALVGAHLQILEGQVNGARGNTEVHKETSELYQWWLAESMAAVYQNQILPDMYAENWYGIEPADVSLGSVNLQEATAQAQLYQAAQSIGLKLSRKQAYRLLSLDEPEDDGDALQPPGGPPGGGPEGPGGGGGTPDLGKLLSFAEENPEGDQTVEDDPDQFAGLMAEVLYGLYGDKALKLFATASEDDKYSEWESFAGKWDPLHHPRGAHGRFIEKGSPEAQATAKEVIGSVLRGDVSPESAEKVAEHLSILTVKQLRELHKEHGQKIPGRLREQLVNAVRKRLPAPKPARTIESYGISPSEADNLRQHAQQAGVDPLDVAKEYGALSVQERRTGWDLMMRALTNVKSKKMKGGGNAQAAPFSSSEEVEDFNAYSEADWAAFAAEDWEPWTLKSGPNKGKKVWKNIKTGKISHEDPNAKAAAKGKGAAPAKPAKPSPEEAKTAKKKAQEEAKAAKEKAKTEAKAKKEEEKKKVEEAKVAKAKQEQDTKDKAVELAKAMAADPKKITAANVKQVGDALLTMKLDELKNLKKSLGATGGTTKASLVDAIKKKIQTPPVAPKPVPKPAPSAKKTPAPAPAPSPAPKPTPATPTGKKKEWGIEKGKDKKAVGNALASLGITPIEAISNPAKKQEVLAELKKTHTSVNSGTVSHYLQNLHDELKAASAKPSTTVVPPFFAKNGASNKKNPNLPHETWPAGLTNDEMAAIQTYTGSAYKQLNNSLRDKGKPPPGFEKTHADLQSAFKKAKPFKPPVKVIRGMNLSGEALNDFLAPILAGHASGESVELNGYTSTSVGSKIIGGFKGNIELHVNAVHGVDVLPVTHYPHEQEFLLNHGSQFTVKSVTKDATTGKIRIELDQLPPDQHSNKPHVQVKGGGKSIAPKPAAPASSAVPATVTGGAGDDDDIFLWPGPEPSEPSTPPPAVSSKAAPGEVTPAHIDALPNTGGVEKNALKSVLSGASGAPHLYMTLSLSELGHAAEHLGASKPDTHGLSYLDEKKAYADAIINHMKGAAPVPGATSGTAPVPKPKKGILGSIFGKIFGK